MERERAILVTPLSAAIEKVRLRRIIVAVPKVAQTHANQSITLLWTQIYSLSEQTKKVLAGLKAPVRVTVFMTGEARLYQSVRELLSRYQDASPRIEVGYLDPRRNLARAEMYLADEVFLTGTAA